jgi:hypothetical protein
VRWPHTGASLESRAGRHPPPCSALARPSTGPGGGAGGARGRTARGVPAVFPPLDRHRDRNRLAQRGAGAGHADGRGAAPGRDEHRLRERARPRRHRARCGGCTRTRTGPYPAARRTAPAGAAVSGRDRDLRHRCGRHGARVQPGPGLALESGRSRIFPAGPRRARQPDPLLARAAFKARRHPHRGRAPAAGERRRQLRRHGRRGPRSDPFPVPVVGGRRWQPGHGQRAPQRRQPAGDALAARPRTDQPARARHPAVQDDPARSARRTGQLQWCGRRHRAQLRLPRARRLPLLRDGRTRGGRAVRAVAANRLHRDRHGAGHPGPAAGDAVQPAPQPGPPAAQRAPLRGPASTAGSTRTASGARTPPCCRATRAMAS